MSPHYPAGTYGVRIDSQKLTLNERTQNYQVVIEFTPFAMENPAVPEDSPERWQGLPVEQYPRALFLPLTERAAEITAEKLERLGIVFDTWAQVDENDPNCVSIVGNRTRLTCKHETYQGKTRDRWDVPFAGGGVQVESVDKTEAAKVQALFGRFAKGRKAAPAQVAAPVPAPAPAPAPATAAKRSAPPVPESPAPVAVAEGDPADDEFSF